MGARLTQARLAHLCAELRHVRARCIAREGSEYGSAALIRRQVGVEWHFRRLVEELVGPQAAAELERALDSDVTPAEIEDAVELPESWIVDDFGCNRFPSDRRYMSMAAYGYHATGRTGAVSAIRAAA